MALGRGHGSMSLSMKLIRLLIILFNLAFIIVGIFLLAVGVYVVRDPKLQQLRPLLNPDLQSAYAQSFSYIEIFAIATIVIGGILLIIGFLGNSSFAISLRLIFQFSSRLLRSNQRFSISTCSLCYYHRWNYSC